MRSATRTAVELLAAAVTLGILGDLLLRETPVGLNVPVWTAALVSAAAVFAWRRGNLATNRSWLLLPILFFAAACAWRASPILTAGNVFALVVAAGIAVVRTPRGKLTAATITDYARGAGLFAADAFSGLPRVLVKEIDWEGIRWGSWSRQAVAVGRGVAIAVPLVLLFGGLFVAADAAFQNVVTGLPVWQPWESLEHAVVTIFWTWLAAGFVRQVAAPPEWHSDASGEGGGFKVGIVEWGVVLALLNALFLAFVLVQVRYLFGGADLVEASTDLTYAEYARRGFFELVAVAALVLPLLLVADALVRTETPTERRVFRGLAAALVLLLFVVMASALERMRLYQQEFGLTELRLYTTAFMLWLAVVFLWFLGTVLRGRRARFTFGAVVAGFVVVASLNALNPDALIARVNVERAAAREPLDVDYVTSLSADAVPTLVELLPTMSADDREYVRAELLASSRGDDADWRSWNLSRVRAERALARLRELDAA